MKKLFWLCAALTMALTSTADEWTLVTDPSDFQAGDQIVLGYAEKGTVASTTITGSSSKYLEGVDYTFTGETLTNLPSNTVIFTLSGSANAWTLTSQEGKVLGATAAKKLAWNNGTTTWTISSKGITSTNTDFGTIQYNGQQEKDRFCNYTSSQKTIGIYRLGGSAPQVVIEFEGFPYRRTLCEIPTYKAGSIYTLPTATPTVDGKTLKAWSFAGDEYLPGTQIIVPETDILFSPVWEGGEGVENTAVRPAAHKTFRDGQLIIIRDGAEYNVLGTRVK